jgi:hypothetical protein
MSYEPMKSIQTVIPAKAGIHRRAMDSRFRGNDDIWAYGQFRMMAISGGYW